MSREQGPNAWECERPRVLPSLLYTTRGNPLLLKEEAA